MHRLKLSKINPIVQNNSQADPQEKDWSAIIIISNQVFIPFIFSKGILKTFKNVVNFEFIADGEIWRKSH